MSSERQKYNETGSWWGEYIRRCKQTLTKKIHQFIQFSNTEFIFIKIGQWIPIFIKFVPLNSQYIKNSIKNVTINNVNYSLDISDYMQWYVWARIKDPAATIANLRTFERICVLDIGANIGAFSLQTANLFDNLNKEYVIHSFEPNKYIFEKLKYNLSLNLRFSNKIIIHHTAISDVSGELNLSWNNENSGAGKVLKQNIGLNNYIEKVFATTVDDFSKVKGLNQIDFIKIDVEGYEPFVINGALKIIEKHKPDIYMEVSPNWWEDNGYKVRDVLNELLIFGYKFYPVINNEMKNESTIDNIEKLNFQFDLYLTTY